MTKTLTLDEILQAVYNNGRMSNWKLSETNGSDILPWLSNDQAKESILQWVADTCIGDDSDTPNVMIAMEHNRQLEILKAAGWKPSDKEEI